MLNSKVPNKISLDFNRVLEYNEIKKRYKNLKFYNSFKLNQNVVLLAASNQHKILLFQSCRRKKLKLLNDYFNLSSLDKIIYFRINIMNAKRTPSKFQLQSEELNKFIEMHDATKTTLVWKHQLDATIAIRKHLTELSSPDIALCVLPTGSG
jgi:hypothetical protein